VIVLAAELEITHHYCDFCARQDENDKDDRQKAENVVKLVKPNGGKDEEELDENSTKWQNASHKNGKEGLHVPNLVRNLSWNLIRSNFNFFCWFLKAKIASEEDERDRNSEPKSDQRHKCAERNGPSRFFVLENKIQEKEDGEDSSREQEGGQDGVLFPVLSLKQFVDSSREISREDSHNNKQNNESGHQTTTIGGGKESKNSKYHCDNGHGNDLNSSSN